MFDADDEMLRGMAKINLVRMADYAGYPKKWHRVPVSLKGKFQYCSNAGMLQG